MKNAKNKIALLLLIAAFLLLIQIPLISCQIKDVFAKSDKIAISTSKDPDTNQNSSGTTKKTTGISDEEKENNLGFFDFKKIKTEVTSSIGVKIKNCNLVLDYFGNLNLLGEIENFSSSNKTSLVITFEFYNKKNEIIFSDTLPVNINYLRTSSKIPFSYTVKDTDRFIDISKIKIGVNYKDYYKLFEGNTIVRKEMFYYRDDILHIEGKLINIGESKVDNLLLLATFYNKIDGVVFIKQGYLPKNNLLPREQENFSLEVLLGKYTPDFTHYGFEVFFEDSVKMP